MIERYVFIKLTEEHATDQGRADVVEQARLVFPGFAGVKAVTVGVPADHGAQVWDVSIVVRFDSVKATEAYQVDPGHRKFVDEFLAPRKQVLKAWSFDVGA